jgi:hypothetical protein
MIAPQTSCPAHPIQIQSAPHNSRGRKECSLLLERVKRNARNIKACIRIQNYVTTHVYEYGSGNCVGLYEIAKVASPSDRRILNQVRNIQRIRNPLRVLRFPEISRLVLKTRLKGYDFHLR